MSDHLPRLDKDDNIFTVHGELPDEFIMSAYDTFSALRNVKTNTSTGPDNTPAWVLRSMLIISRPRSRVYSIHFMFAIECASRLCKCGYSSFDVETIDNEFRL